MSVKVRFGQGFDAPRLHNFLKKLPFYGSFLCFIDILGAENHKTKFCYGSSGFLDERSLGERTNEADLSNALQAELCEREENPRQAPRLQI